MFIISLEESSREMRSGWRPEKCFMFFALIIESLDYIKKKLETWKGAVESKALRINVKKTKIVIINRFVPNARFFYPLKISENRNVFRGYRKDAFGANGLIRKPESFPM